MTTLEREAPTRGAGSVQRSVVVVGGGPVGLTLALRLAQGGVDVEVLEAGDGLRREGSKALCMQRETLEVWQRLGLGQQVADAGVSWKLGRTYFRDRELFQTTFPVVGRDHFPPFVNISQTEVEDVLLDRAREVGIAVRWSAQVTGVTQDSDGVTLGLRDGSSVRADYVVACDGARSTVRELLGVEFEGHSHSDVFLIADIKADLPFPDERRFYFDPPFNPGRTVLVHPQRDQVWRIDWQVPPDTSAETEQTSGRLEQRIRKIVGDVDYQLVWLTAYRFHQRIADRMTVGRVFLAGDAAHLMSPFGARGMNSGVADAENLAWKLRAVVSGEAPVSLLGSYAPERHAAALENLSVTDATMRFMVPASRARRVLRDIVLRGSTRSPRVRARVNSGRLAAPHVYAASPVVEPGCGAVAADGPVAWAAGEPAPGLQRLRELFGQRMAAVLVPAAGAEVTDVVAGLPARAAAHLVLVLPAGGAAALAGLELAGATVVTDNAGVLTEAYGTDTLTLVRPDGHVAARRPATAVDQLPELVSAALGGPVAAGVLR